MQASICDVSLALCWFNTAARSRMPICDVSQGYVSGGVVVGIAGRSRMSLYDVGEGYVGDVVGLDDEVEDGQKNC